MTLLISLDHLRSCGSSLFIVESWVSNLNYCNKEETPHKAMPKSLNHYVFSSFCFLFACFFMYWNLKSGSCTCQTSALLLEPYLQPKIQIFKESL
jgi:hypothetical protein